MSRRASAFQTIHSEGGLLPPDLLRRVVDPAARLPGTRPEDYGLPPGERLNEVIVQSWNRLQRHWADFQSATAGLAEGEAGTALTNDRWTLPLTRELGFGTLPTSVSPTIDDKTYAISRFSGAVPLHLIGRGLSLDRRKAGQKGAASSNPHGLVQEYLNRAPDAIWGIVSNGLELRILRDSQALSRQSYLAFDLQAMMAGAVYSDFVLLWMTAHATRFVPRDPNRPGTCWLEEWTQVAVEDGTRAFTDLRAGVEKALQILGEGFTSHPANTALRDALRTNQLTPPDLHYQLLRVVYRLLFLFVAEDRTLDHLPVLHPPGDTDADRAARDRYAKYYSTGRLRDLADRIKGSRHGDLWRQFQLLVGALSGDPKFSPLRESLALPVLGSLLWDPARTASLNGQGLAEINGTELSNYDFLEALRHLAYIQQDGARRAVDFKNLGSDEFGGIYESLLSLTPQVIGDGSRFTFAEFAGNERKTSGSYYTPDSLVQCLLDSALEPVVDERLAGKTGADAEKALLALKVCDPAVGSGHFLVGAAHRLARRLARIRANMAGESEPSPRLYQHALRDVIGRCLYGVDINEMSAELCRVTLWLEAIEPGKPLSFLDHHIRVGNSLIGTTPELIKGGIPDGVYDVIEGDDKEACSALKKQNRRENPKLGEWFSADEAAIRDKLHQAALAIDEMDDSRPEDVHRKEAAFRDAQQNKDFQKAWDFADLWCAAFVIKKQFAGGTAAIPPSLETSMPNPQPSTVQTGLFGGSEDVSKAKTKKAKAPSRAVSEVPFGITTQHLLDCVEGGALADSLHIEVKRLAKQYQFFHFHLAFPEVFAQGGFDLSLGNPPWDTLSPDQREFFGQWVSGLRSMSPEKQKLEIDGLLADETISTRWTDHCRYLFTLVNFLKNSGVYTLFAPGNLGKGDFNTYRMFIELALRKIRIGGRAAMVVPGGLYGGANASSIRKHMFDECRLTHIFGLINTSRGWFENVDIDRFAAFAAKRGGRTTTIRTQFGLKSPEELLRPAVDIEADPIRQLAPDTYAIPDIRNVSELTTSRKIYGSCPAFGGRASGLPYRHYSRELDMGSDRDLFTYDPAGLPVYEGRMIDNFDHRAKTYQSGHGNSAVWLEREFGDPGKAIVPQWRVLRHNIPAKLGNRCQQFRIGFGDVANPRNQRSFTATLIPPHVVCGHKVPTFVFDSEHEWAYLPWLAVANSFTMDWLARCRLTAPTMSYTLLDSLPFPRPSLTDNLVQSLAPIVLRLVCTAPEMTPFWNRMAKYGFVEGVAEGSVPPSAFVEPYARAIARAELDAFIAARVFDLTTQELSDILDTFETLRRSEERTRQEFRTKKLILDAFVNGAAFQPAKQAGIPVPTWMDRPLVLPKGRRIGLSPERYRAALVPHLLYQAGGSVSFERFRKAYWLLTEPMTLQRYAFGPVGEIAREWARNFSDKLERDRFIEHLKGAVGRQLHFIRRGNERWLELRDPKIADDEYVIFDARIALLVADLWPITEPIPPLAPAEESAVQELEAVL
jgi:hypothetical protein